MYLGLLCRHMTQLSVKQRRVKFLKLLIGRRRTFSFVCYPSCSWISVGYSILTCQPGVRLAAWWVGGEERCRWIRRLMILSCDVGLQVGGEGVGHGASWGGSLGRSWLRGVAVNCKSHVIIKRKLLSNSTYHTNCFYQLQLAEFLNKWPFRRFHRSPSIYCWNRLGHILKPFDN